MDEENIPDPLEADNQGRPEWLPEKFKSPEDLAKSYGELESRLGELSERAKQADALENNYVELATRLEQVEAQRAQQVGNDAAAPLIQAYQSAMETGDYAAALSIQAQVSQMAAQSAVSAALPQLTQRTDEIYGRVAEQIAIGAAEEVRSRYGNEAWESARDGMQAILARDPDFIPEAIQHDRDAVANRMEYLFKLATYGQDPVARNQESHADLLKQQAQTATGAGTRVLTPDEVKQEWDAIKNAAPRTYYS